MTSGPDQPAAAAAADSDLRGPGLRAFFRIAECWKMSDREIAGALGVEIHEIGPLRDGRLEATPEGALVVIGHVLSIFRSINILLPDPNRADAWMRRASAVPGYDELTPIDLITTGSHHSLIAVHAYLYIQTSLTL